MGWRENGKYEMEEKEGKSKGRKVSDKVLKKGEERIQRKEKKTLYLTRWEKERIVFKDHEISERGNIE